MSGPQFFCDELNAADKLQVDLIYSADRLYNKPDAEWRPAHSSISLLSPGIKT